MVFLRELLSLVLRNQNFKKNKTSQTKCNLQKQLQLKTTKKAFTAFHDWTGQSHHFAICTNFRRNFGVSQEQMKEKSTQSRASFIIIFQIFQQARTCIDDSRSRVYFIYTLTNNYCTQFYKKSFFFIRHNILFLFYGN